MRKNKLSDFFKIGILFFGISLLLFNCEKEEKQSLNQGNLWKMQDISKNDLKNKVDFDSFLRELNQKKSLKSERKEETDTLYNFTIDYTTIREIQLENITSYTFKIIRENASESYFENLVILSSQNQIQKAYLIKYTPKEEIEYIEAHNTITFAGKVNLTNLDIANLNYSMKGNYCTEVTVPYCSWSYPHVAGADCWIQQQEKQDGRIYFVLTTICESDGFIEPPVDAGHGGGTGFGGGPGYDGDTIPTTPIGITNQGEKCEKPPKGDLNGDCMLDFYESCLLKNSQEVCDCAVVSNDLNECIDDYFDEQIFVDESFKNNTCLKNVYEKMGKASKFKEYLQNFEAEFSVAHLRFTSSTTLPVNINAQTSAPENYLINITFNENNLDRPSLSVARTFIHEVIHAEIFRKLLSVGQQPNLQFTQWYAQDPQIWFDFLVGLKDNFEGLYDYYMRLEWDVPPGQSPSDVQHNLMSTHYRDIIKQALKEFDSSQAEAIYEALSWTGLMGTGTFNTSTGLFSESTVAWSNLTQTQRLNIISNRNNFIKNNPNCQ